MTTDELNREAIKQLKVIKVLHAEYANNAHIDLAISALKKQISQPLKKSVSIDPEIKGVCPACCAVQVYRKDKHCYHCGQRFDWS